uniref:Uncharacterized protein n=1 Tax=Tanacetum cinerariifolium TaxID=118510 RepID=A0A699JVX8_TANCI|nr:hypothetical protein [Tanacetum cinerariifolium]
MWVKTGLPPPMPPKKKVMPGRPKGKRKKHPSLCVMQYCYEEDADPANADHANADPANADPANADPANADPVNSNPEEMEHGEMEQPVHMEDVQEADVQEHVLRRGLKLRRPSQRILLNK